MCRSIVLIMTDKETKRVAEQMLLHEGVIKNLYRDFGGFNLIADIETDDAQKLDLFIKEQIMPIPQVKSVKKIICSQENKSSDFSLPYQAINTSQSIS